MKFIISYTIKNEIIQLFFNYEHETDDKLTESFIRKFNLIIKKFYLTRKNTDSKNAKVVKSKNGRMFSSNCAVCGSKKLRFIKKARS